MYFVWQTTPFRIKPVACFAVEQDAFEFVAAFYRKTKARMRVLADFRC